MTALQQKQVAICKQDATCQKTNEEEDTDMLKKKAIKLINLHSSSLQLNDASVLDNLFYAKDEDKYLFIIKSYTFNDIYTKKITKISKKDKKKTLFMVDYFTMYKTVINILKNVNIWCNHGNQTA